MLKPSTPADPAAAQRRWPEGARAAAEALQRQLSINDRQWHALKGQPRRRAAEQLAAALVQLLATDVAAKGADSDRDQSLALVESAAAWLRGSQRDPGCPQHRR
ncbi:MAG: DUF6439 family protein [Prochlorococcaceae cyanobacterium]